MARVMGWRPGPVGIGLLAGLLGAVDLGARMFTTNDEARFPLLAQDILARGEWLWPQLNGSAYYNKPPLLAWLIVLVSWPVGHVTQLTAVIPSAAAGVATVVFIYQIARDLFGADAGRFAALVAMTTQGLFFHAHLSLPDVLMTCFITASLWMFVRMAQDRPGPWWIGFYACAGAAFWAKGPAGLLPLAIAIVHAVATRSHRRWSLRLAAGLPLVAGPVALWWLLGALSDSRATTETVVIDHLAWYRPHAPSLATLTAPLRNTLAVLSPWVLLAPLAILAVRRFGGPKADRDALRFLLVWLGVAAALIGLSNQQRLRYYVPLVPPMAVLLGWWLESALVTARRDRLRRLFVVLWVGCVLAFVGGYRWELHRHNLAGGYAGLAARMKPLIAGAPVVAAWGTPELPLAFYLDRTVTRIGSEQEFRDVLAREPRSVVVASEANWAGLAEGDRVTAVAHVLVRGRTQP
jgi:4-amino-4-deoxy-L-arabinose transferase-like glycosyltransferase